MNIFNQLGGQMAKEAAYDRVSSGLAVPYKPRTFREQIQDQIAHHKAKVDDLEAVLVSMTPEVEKFVEAMQKIS